MWYKATYELSELEYILANSDKEALEYALDKEEEYGYLYNLFLLDDEDNIIKTIF